MKSLEELKRNLERVKNEKRPRKHVKFVSLDKDPFDELQERYTKVMDDYKKIKA